LAQAQAHGAQAPKRMAPSPVDPATHGDYPLRLTPRLMVNLSIANMSLLRYFLPSRPSLDVRKNWVPFTQDCILSERCFCFHVEGLMAKDMNPDGASRCFHDVEGPAWQDCSRSPIAQEDCACLVPWRNCSDCCLFGDMRPLKLLAAISLMRAVGVTHVIEEGRYGGLSAYVYALHGLHVTSIESLPLRHVTATLRRLAPGVTLLDGDGSQLLPSILGTVDPVEERIAVVFDGEKRFKAYETYSKIRDKVAVAIFDDTNIGWLYFRKFLRQVGEVVWHSDDRSYRRFALMEKAPLDTLSKPLRGKRMQGGLAQLEGFHFTAIQGGAWPGFARSART